MNKIFIQQHYMQYMPWFVVVVSCLLSIFFAIYAYRSLRDAIALSGEENHLFGNILSPIVEKIRPRTDIGLRLMRLKLQQAGLRHDQAMNHFVLFRAISLVVAVLCICLSFMLSYGFYMQCLLCLILLFIGLKLPEVWLQRRINMRHFSISRAIPTLMDLMVLCLDVGLSIESAFERVTREIQTVEPLMAEEASLMLSEISAGINFPQALTRMAQRIGLEEMDALARVVTQASMLGASIAQSLREYSEQSFNKRIFALEETASKITGYMVLPLASCLLPAALLVIAVPIFISIQKGL